MPKPCQRAHLVVLLSYTFLALSLTYPLITAPSHIVPGSDTWAYDEYTFLWNMWWFKRATLDLGTNPMFTSHTFYPVGAPLVLYTYQFVNAATGLPLYLVSNLPLASNITLWLSMILGGYTTYLLTRYVLVRRLGRSDGTAVHLAAFLGGIAYSFAASRFVYLALGHYCIFTTQFLPLFALFLLRTLDDNVAWKRYALLSSIAFTLSALAEMTFALFLGILLLVFILGEVRNLGWRPLLARVALLSGAATALYSPVLFYVLRETFVGDYALVGWGNSLKLSADLIGLLTPTALHPLWGDDWPTHLREVATGTARFSDVHTVFLGYAALGLALIGLLIYRRRTWTWSLTLLLAVAFSLGPLLQINGQYRFDLDGLETTVPMPFILLHYIPLASAGRAPNRFSVLVLLTLAPLAGIGAHVLLRRIPRWWLSAIVATFVGIALIGESISIPVPTTDASVPSFYQTLAEDKEDYAILSLPFGLRSSFATRGAERTQLQYYQTVHNKRIIGGNISRAPQINFEYYERVAPLAHLMAIEAYQSPAHFDIDRDRHEAAALAALLDIRYLIVHSPVPGRLPYADTYDDALAYASRIFDLTEVHRDPQGSLVAYEIRQAPISESFTLDIGSGTGAMYLGEGWSTEEPIAGTSARWVNGTVAVLYLPTQQDASVALTLKAAPFVFPGSSQQSMAITVNEHPIASFAMAEGWHQYTVNVPAQTLHQGPNKVELSFTYARRPIDVFPETYSIGATGVRAPTYLELHSTTEIAYISVGTKDGSLHTEGLNLAVVDPQHGELLVRRSFNWNDATAMLRFVERVAPGQVVLVATKGGFLGTSNEDICRALRMIGSVGCPAPGSTAYAAIGARGAPPGTALETAGNDAYLRIAPDKRSLSAAVDWVKLQHLP